MRANREEDDDAVKIAEISPALSQKMANMSLVAAVFVVMMHVGSDMVSESCCFDWFCALVKRGVCQVAMPWFFFAAGFFVMNRFGESGWYRTCLQKRVRSLVVPFLSWGVLYALFSYGLVKTGLSHYQWPYQSCWHLLGKIFGIGYHLPMVPPFWFMRALMGLVIMVPVFAWLIRRTPYVALVLSYLLAWYSPILNSQLGLPDLFLYSGIPLQDLPYFLVGIYVRMNGAPLIARREWWALTAPCAICMLGVSYGLDWPWLKWPGLLLALVSVWHCIPETRWPKFLTSASFPVYLIHYMCITGMAGMYKHFGLSEFYNQSIAGYLLQVFVILMLSFGGAWMIRACSRRYSWLFFGGR